jgi:RimJ/RimL family protein N-acetyltransferase
VAWPVTEAVLAGPRVVLVPLQARHLDGPYISWLNDEEVCRFNSHNVERYTRADAERYLEDVTASGDLVLAVHLADGGDHVGNISLQGIDRSSRSAEFAVLMGDRRVWGTGCATEAARLLVDHGFRTLGLHRIFAGTMAANEPMRRLAARLGMREEGVLRDGMCKLGTYHDVVLFSVLEGEWEAEPAG